MIDKNKIENKSNSLPRKMANKIAAPFWRPREQQ